jgi:hypothetical protein
MTATSFAPKTNGNRGANGCLIAETVQLTFLAGFSETIKN